MACNNCGDLTLLTVTATARVLGVDRRTVYNIIRSGKLRFMPRGRKAKRIPLFELRRYEESQLISNGPEYLKALDRRRA